MKRNSPPDSVTECQVCKSTTVESCDDRNCGFLGAGNGAPEAPVKTNKNPGKKQRQRARKKEEQNRGVNDQTFRSPRLPACSNPRFHPQHCDCPVHEDVLAFIEEGSIRRFREPAAITSYVSHNDLPQQDFCQETPPLPEISVGIERSKTEEELLEKIRDCYREIGHLKSKNKDQQKVIESLNNQLKEARNNRKGKVERRKKVKTSVLLRSLSSMGFSVSVVTGGKYD